MSRQPTLKQLKYLLAVADAGHFGQAAKACFVSQSTLSAGIAELEDLLGVVLLERTHRNILLTDIGKEVVTRARSRCWILKTCWQSVMPRKNHSQVA